jgi:hypothetical protein
VNPRNTAEAGHAFLALDDGQLISSQGWGPSLRGWGQGANPNISYDATLEEGRFVLYRRLGLLGRPKEVLHIGIMSLELRTGTTTKAALLNKRSARSTEYALLYATYFHPSGAKPEVVLGFASLRESELRQRLANASPRWLSAGVDIIIRDWSKSKLGDDVLSRSGYPLIDKMRSRGMLLPDHHARLETYLATRGPRPVEPSDAISAADRVTQLKTLADLRASGALTDAEFQAEKARLLAQ